jgi:hypothetical protein
MSSDVETNDAKIQCDVRSIDAASNHKEFICEPGSLLGMQMAWLGRIDPYLYSPTSTAL